MLCVADFHYPSLHHRDSYSVRGLLLPNDVPLRITEGQATHHELQVTKASRLTTLLFVLLDLGLRSSIPGSSLVDIYQKFRALATSGFWLGFFYLATQDKVQPFNNRPDSADTDGATTPGGSLPVVFASLASHLC